MDVTRIEIHRYHERYVEIYIYRKGDDKRTTLISDNDSINDLMWLVESAAVLHNIPVERVDSQ